ncbi:tRNA (N(6)-L-threonylcarbamoyladenosine(37)-C(2))-methylthiotransferase MtaB [uncultured Ilyobacter sp.]|uniref:tRNA (N(6)-L-threonylcarbamoyladenosine(37)-C(2))- methylthiotransferase MtaB n=1 Tax=uncultured Ilyobacter sp. TaxID=544433 RepID=UPI002AA65D5F|nr:tRNA (N(6)-L-threonylcarbamoyladenosine(37)-C(2))-methylthiotransferase MtaB [uncultured Ilyobacter sp.]
MISNKKAAFCTLGCKVNQYETESIKKQLSDLGYDEVNFDDKADVYIVNSCTVTTIADRKTRNMLRRAKKNNPDSLVIATGCYAQTNAKELEAIEEIDYVIGNSDKSGIINLISNIESDKTSERVIHRNIFDAKEYEELEFSTLREMSRAYIKIQDGCNNFCSYCKIPFARGKSRSRKLESILKEAEILAEEGFKEIIIIGINLGVYGEDIPENGDFETLLDEISKVNGIERIRIGSMYPDKISDRFIALMKNNEKLMPHLHISLQSCDDEILKAMNRNYDSRLIKERLLKLKNAVNNIEYTADVIVGFPGEKEKNFGHTLSLIEEIGFSDLHIFQYSDRENTAASRLPEKVDSKTKKARAEKLEVLKEKMQKSLGEKYMGETMEVLVEETKNGNTYGYSRNYIKVEIVDYLGKVNELVEVLISGVENGRLRGGKKTK